MKKIAFLLLGAVVALSSCSKEEPQAEGSDSNVVSFSASDIRTRVTGTSFDLNDVITVQAYQDGVAFASADYTYVGNSNEFTSATPISYQSDAAIELSYQAVYPAVESFSNSFTHTISTDQSVADNYESSDLLVATVDATTSLKPSLTFLHRMSLVNITVVVNRDGVASTTDVVSSLKVNAAVEAACDIAADTYSASGSVVEITPAGSALSYGVLVAPQSVAAGGFAVATIGNEVFTMTNTEATLVSGYVYELKWTIDLTTAIQTVEFEGVIDNWIEGVWGEDIDTTPQEDTTLTITFGEDTFDSQNTTAEYVIDGATFNTYNFYTYSSLLATGYGSYLYNRTELVGLSEIIIDYSSSSELTIYAGAEVYPTTDAIAGVANSDGDMVYTIPADCKFISIVNETSTYNNSNSITINYTSLGDTVDTPAEEPNDDPTLFTYVEFLEAMGVDAPATSGDVTIDTVEFDDFTLVADKGTATTGFRLYNSGGTITIRSYAGNAVTITAKDGKKVKSVEFDVSAISDASVGTFSSTTWSSDEGVDEVTLTMLKATISSITIVVE